MSIIGAGRVGRSMAAWWRALGHEVALADRRHTGNAEAVRQATDSSDLVAIALPDGAIQPFIEKYRKEIEQAEVIHFSGAISVDGATAYHPLYSFPTAPAPVADLSRALIARPAGAAPFWTLVPGAANPEIEVAPEDRALYHALAVVSGNFAAHLMNEAAAQFAARFGADPAGALGPYYESVVARFRENALQSMTGPLARRDAGSVAANLEALAAAPRLAALYRAFLASAWPDYPAGVK